MSLFMVGDKRNSGGRIYPTPPPVEWTKWKRTFCLLPRKDITGIYVIGPMWYRMQESRIHEYEDDVGYYISSGLGFIEYARTKKDIFLRSLTGKEEHGIKI